MESITGLTLNGTAWTPEFVTELDPKKCIGCGRCYKVCTRNVFNLVERSSIMEADDDHDDDDEMMVMVIQDAMDCIGCKACSAVCPKNCHSHATQAA